MQTRHRQIVSGFGIAVAGLALIIVGAIQFHDIMAMEAAGDVHGLTPKVKVVYGLLGKWGVLGAFSLAGLCGLFAGGEKLWNGARPEPRGDRPTVDRAL